MIQYTLFIISLCCFIIAYFINKKKKSITLILNIKQLEILKTRNNAVNNITKNISLLGTTALAYGFIYHDVSSFNHIGITTFFFIAIYCIYNIFKSYKSI